MLQAAIDQEQLHELRVVQGARVVRVHHRQRPGDRGAEGRDVQRFQDVFQLFGAQLARAVRVEALEDRGHLLKIIGLERGRRGTEHAKVRAPVA